MPDSIELSEREQEILKLVATGASNKEIAYSLSISTNTVKVHLRNIFAKIGAISRTEAAMYAVKNGMVEGTGVVMQGQFNGSDTLPVSEPLPKQQLNYWLTVLLALAIIVLVGLASYVIWNSLRQTPVEVSQSSEAQWQENPAMPTARYGLATAAYENLIFAIAGRTTNGETGIVERYNPELNSWDILSTKPTAVSDISAAVLGGKIYIPGGRMNSGEMTDVLEIYDTRLDQWSEGASLPVPVSAYAIAPFEGRIYLFGGWDGEKYLGNTYAYDPESDSWTPLAGMPTPRAYAGAGVVGRKIYVIGGYDGKKVLAVNEAFLPDGIEDPLQAWEAHESMPTAGFAMGVSSVADSIYVLGGLEKPNLPRSEIYVYQEGAWNTLLASNPELGSNLGLVNLSAYLYAIGGLVKKTPSDINLSYKVLYTISVPLISK